MRLRCLVNEGGVSVAKASDNIEIKNIMGRISKTFPLPFAGKGGFYIQESNHSMFSYTVFEISVINVLAAATFDVGVTITHNIYGLEFLYIIATSFSVSSSSPVLFAVSTPLGTPAGILEVRVCCFINDKISSEPARSLETMSRRNLAQSDTEV